MKYSELINYRPITEVIQLKNAENPKLASELVKDFVASKYMVDTFTDVIYPHLQFNRFNDNKL